MKGIFIDLKTAKILQNIIKEVKEKIHKAIIDSEIVGNGELNLSKLLEILDRSEK